MAVKVAINGFGRIGRVLHSDRCSAQRVRSCCYQRPYTKDSFCSSTKV